MDRAMHTTFIPHRRPQCGLTLIELCVAVALLALITTMSYRGLDSMSRTSDRTLAESERWQSLALFFERFGADVAQPANRPVRNEVDPEKRGEAGSTQPASPLAATAATTRQGIPTGLLPAWWGRSQPEGHRAAPAPGNESTADQPDRGERVDRFAAQLEFTRLSADGRNAVRLGYRLRESRIELLLWPVLDRAPSSRPEIFTLLEDVKSLRFRHLDAAGLWQNEWPVFGSIESLPRAVQVELTLLDGTKLNRTFAVPAP